MSDVGQIPSGPQSFSLVGQGISATEQATLHLRDVNIHSKLDQ